MSFEIILSMAGGLGLFLFGMTVMSESIEKVAGAKLRSILEMSNGGRTAQFCNLPAVMSSSKDGLLCSLSTLLSNKGEPQFGQKLKLSGHSVPH